MTTYRTDDNHWRPTVVVSEHGQPDEPALQTVETFRTPEQRQLLAERVAELLTAVEAACDCGHEGLELMFHLHPCPVAVLRNAARKRR